MNKAEALTACRTLLNTLSDSSRPFGLTDADAVSVLSTLVEEATLTLDSKKQEIQKYIDLYGGGTV